MIYDQAITPRVLFDHEHKVTDPSTGKTYSTVLFIPTGRAALLSMYNYFNMVHLEEGECCDPQLVNNSCITIHKVSYGKGRELPPLQRYCDWVPKLNDIYKKMLECQEVWMEEVCQCGSSWVLTPGNNYALLTIPGFYVFEIKDLTQIENCYIEYYLLTLDEAAMIPDAFKLGA